MYEVFLTNFPIEETPLISKLIYFINKLLNIIIELQFCKYNYNYFYYFNLCNLLAISNICQKYNYSDKPINLNYICKVI